MDSYPVIWKDAGAGDLPVAGRLQFGERGLTLHGGPRGAERRVDVPFAAIACAARSGERVGRLRAIALDVRDLGTLLLAVPAGPSLATEVLGRIQVEVAGCA